MGKCFTDEEREQYSKLIYKIAEQLFSDMGFKKTTVSQIMGKVGIAKGSFYSFYTSKEALFFQILLDREERQDREFLEKLNKLSKTRDFIEVLIELIDYGIESLEYDLFMKNTWDQVLMKSVWNNIDSSLQQKSIENDRHKLKKQLDFAAEYGYKIACSVDVYTATLRTLVFAFLGNDISKDIESEVRKNIITGTINELFVRT